jgi:hypothetical protein
MFWRDCDEIAKIIVDERRSYTVTNEDKVRNAKNRLDEQSNLPVVVGKPRKEYCNGAGLNAMIVNPLAIV